MAADAAAAVAPSEAALGAQSPSSPSPTPSPPPPAKERLSAHLPSAEVPRPRNYDALPVLSRSDIANRIARGELLVLQPPLVYRIPHRWLELHPGGHHAILHYVGRDASCEIMAYHSARTVGERMARWVCGRVEVDDDDETEGEGWRDMTPPIQLGKWPIPIPTITVSSPPPTPVRRRSSAAQGERPEKESLQNAFLSASSPPSSTALPEAVDVLTPEMVDPPLRPEQYAYLPLTPAYQAHLRRSSKRLYARIQAQGLDSPPRFLAGYGPSLLIYISLALASVWTYRRAVASSATLDYLFAAICLGAFYHQVTFVVHDAGHTGLTGNWLVDRLWGIGIADFMGGLSVGWWADNHNVHHREWIPTESVAPPADAVHRPASRHECARARSRYSAPAVLCHLDALLRVPQVDLLRPARRVRWLRSLRSASSVSCASLNHRTLPIHTDLLRASATSSQAQALLHRHVFRSLQPLRPLVLLPPDPLAGSPFAPVQTPGP